MNEKILDQLENVPYSAVKTHEDAFCELKSVVDFNAELYGISAEERKRLDYELELVKNWGIAKVFLFGFNLSRFAVTLGIEGYSYINYLLGVSTVNPVTYNLPFERFFNERRKLLPTFFLYVEKGKKGLLLKSVYEKFGKSTVVRACDSKNEYYVSSKAIRPEFIKEKIIVTKLNEEAYEENISVLTGSELSKLEFYGFSVIEVNNIKRSSKEKFSEENIYHKTKELFADKRPNIPCFTEIDDVKEILKDTQYKLVYQEQFIDILNIICGYDMSKADYLRREIVKFKKDSLAELEKALLDKYCEKGRRLFDYLYNTVRYAVSKAYVLANLHNFIEFGE